MIWGDQIYSLPSGQEANFVGIWAGLSGTLSAQALVYHNNRYWKLLANLTDTAASEPGSPAEAATDPNMTTDSWTVQTGWSYDAVNQQYDCDGSQATTTRLYQGIGAETGDIYEITFTISNYVSGGVAAHCGGADGSTESSDGVYTQIVVSTGVNSLGGVKASDDFVGSVDSISMKKIDWLDMSTNRTSVRTGLGSVLFGVLNELQDSNSYNLPAANSVQADDYIDVMVTGKYSAQTPTVSVSGADTLTDEDGADADGEFSFSESRGFTARFISDGVSDWRM